MNLKRASYFLVVAAAVAGFYGSAHSAQTVSANQLQLVTVAKVSQVKAEPLLSVSVTGQATMMDTSSVVMTVGTTANFSESAD